MSCFRGGAAARRHHVPGSGGGAATLFPATGDDAEPGPEAGSRWDGCAAGAAGGGCAALRLRPRGP